MSYRKNIISFSFLPDPFIVILFNNPAPVNIGLAYQMVALQFITRTRDS